MGGARVFFDTNVLLYLLSEDASKAGRAEELLEKGGWVSVQVLNEFSSIATRKLGMSWDETKEVLAAVRAACQVESITIETHERAVQIVERYQLSIYDALMVAAALLAGCGTLYSEDMQSGQRIDKSLRIINPFSS